MPITTLAPMASLGKLLILITLSVPLTACTTPTESQGTPLDGHRPPLPERWEGHYLEEPVFGGRVFVVEAGSRNAPPVFLVHGLGQNGLRDWREVIMALEGDHRVVALDLPGFGRSPTPSGPLSPERYANLLAWLMERLEVDKAHLVGHSMGGAISIYFAAHYPTKVKDLFVADVAGILHRVAFLSGIVSLKDYDSGLPPILASGLQGLLGPGNRLLERILVTTDLDPTWVLQRGPTPWQGFLDERPNVNAAISLLETNFSAEVHSLAIPTTLVWGSDDEMVPIRTGHLLHGLLPRNAFHVLEGADHTPMRSRTDGFMHLLKKALATPPERMPTEPSQQTLEDRECYDQENMVISGDFDEIRLSHCSRVKLHGVRANRVRISSSSDVSLRHVKIESDKEDAGLRILDSEVEATDLQVTGEPAIWMDGGQLDLAGGSLHSTQAALVTYSETLVVVSVSRIKSGVRKGYLHGAVLAPAGVLDDDPSLTNARRPR